MGGTPSEPFPIKDNPLYSDPPHNLPTDLQQAVKKALAAANTLPPTSLLCGQVREAKERLSEEERQLIEWYFWDGLSERAIAEQLGCSHVAVHERLRRVWRRLCQALGVDMEFPGRRGKNSPKKGKNRGKKGKKG